MHKLYRSVLLTGMVAVGLAGCGDDVTVTQPPAPPPPPTPTVRSITVAPNPGSVAIGGTITMSAAVVADSGVSTAVTWSSADATKATVNATSGVVTGVASGSVAIKATSTVNANVSGVATVSVTAAPAAATISIGGVTTAGGAPVLLAGVAGQINVVLNLERGGENVQSIKLFLGTTEVGSQAFTAASDEPEAAIELITIPVNTAAFNATTGVPTHFNGPTTLSARVITAQNQQGNASPSLSLTLANANTFATTASLTGGFAPAISAGGLNWVRGGLDVTVLPVLYTPGTTMGAGSVTFGTAGCDAGGVGQRTRTLVAPAAGSFAWTASFANTGTPGVTNVANYELNAAGCPGTVLTGENVTVTATSTGGNPVLTGATPVGGLGLRLDNQAPGAPTFVANPNLRQNQWINAAVGLAGANTGATSNNWMVNGAADLGVGGYTRQVRTGDGPTAAAARAAAPTTTLPAPSLNNNSYCALASAIDLLGNESALTSAGTTCNDGVVASNSATGLSHQAFGVDIAAPTIAFSGGLASNARLNGGAVGTEFQVTVSDTGTVGNSGMLSGSAVRGTVQIRSAALTPPSAGSCFLGTFSGGACNAVSVNGAPAFPLVPTTTVAAATGTGYYTYNAFSQDAAGNQSAAVTRVIAYDAAANVPALTSALFNVPLTGPTAVFNANASDNFDLGTAVYTLTYAGGLVGPIVHPTVTLNTFNTAPLVNSNVAAGITVNGFVRQMEDVTGNAPLAVSGQYKPTSLSGVVTDMALNPSAAAVTAIPGASVTNGVSYTAAAAPQLMDSWAITAPAAAVNVSRGISTGGAVPQVANVTFNVDAFGPTATFNAPFTRVDFYLVVGGNLMNIGSTTSFSTLDNGAPQGRRHRYSFTWTPPSTTALGAAAIYAVGVNAAGDGLVAPVNGNITIVNNP